MATIFDTDIYPIFYLKIANDRDFFKYVNVTNEEALEIAEARSYGLLIESISKLTLNSTPDIDFYDKTEDQFNETLTDTEIDILTEIMKEKLFEKDELKLKSRINRFSTKDVNMFSAANERNSFIEMCRGLTYKNDVLISKYSSRDRLTGKRKIINYNYDEV